MAEDLRAQALAYHAAQPAGKMQTLPTKPMTTQHDLALAYSPGVAIPCEVIAQDPSAADLYTGRANTVAVVTNGTAVLGLGNIGALASKPVMEGKAALFKKFSGLDCIDLEVDEEDPSHFIEAIARLEPSVGGINLEDIKAPECFVIEKALKERMSIPVFHDDQHGTAIVCAAGVLNALEIVGKKLEEVRIVANGAGAASLACLDLLCSFGAQKENIIVCDSKGVIHCDRTDLDKYKGTYAARTEARSLADAVTGADIFLGLSVAGALTQDMAASMASRPIIFAMANPEPEIRPEVARAVQPDAILATGRSDYSNQVNNVLCFPFIFRGALDCGATEINEEMKRACALAIADLARRAPPHQVSSAYGGVAFTFGPDYIIPKPFDPRLITEIAPLVAQAAAKTGVARRPIPDLEAYKDQLLRHVFRSGLLMKPVFALAAQPPARVVYAEGEFDRVLHCADQAVRQNVARPLLIGRERVILDKIGAAGLSLRPGATVDIVDPATIETDAYAAVLHKLAGRDGVSLREAQRGVTGDPTVLASLMLAEGEADAAICGIGGRFGHHLERISSIVGLASGASRLSTLMGVILPGGTVFVADAYATLDPTAEEVAENAVLAADAMRKIGIEPKVALISHSNFGDRPSPSAWKMKNARDLLAARNVDFQFDGEMQVSAALGERNRAKVFKHSALDGPANLLLMPNADAAHASIELLREMAGAVTIGPILLGAAKPVHIVSNAISERGLLNLTALASVSA